MRTFLYHPKYPEGKIFDTEGREAPYPPPASAGWVEHRGDLKMTEFERGQQMVENAVRAELARQEKEGRAELDREHVKKYGVEPHPRATTEQVANIMDNKTLNGEGRRPTLKVPRKATETRTYSRPEERVIPED